MTYPKVTSHGYYRYRSILFSVNIVNIYRIDPNMSRYNMV